MATIGDRLREERQRLGYSQVEFAQLAGVKKHSQMRYEKNLRSPDGDYLAAIAELGADVTYILTGQRTAASQPELTPEERIFLEMWRQLPDSQKDAFKELLVPLAQCRSKKKRA